MEADASGEPVSPLSDGGSGGNNLPPPTPPLSTASSSSQPQHDVQIGEDKKPDCDWRQGLNITQRFETALTMGDDCSLKDVKFRVGQGPAVQVFGAHRKMLEIACKQFEDMFAKESYTVTGVIIIDLPDVDPCAFQILLEHIYSRGSRDFNLSLDVTLKVLEVTQKFEMCDLTAKCLTNIRSSLDPQDGQSLISVWEKVFHLEHERRIMAFMVPQVARVPDEVFLNLSEEALCAFLKRDDVPLQEVIIFRKTLAWARHRLPSSPSPNSEPAGTTEGNMELRATFGRALRLIRFPVIPLDTLLQEVQPLGLLTHEEIVPCFMVKYAVGPSQIKSCQKIAAKYFPVSPRGGKIKNKASTKTRRKIPSVSQTDPSVTGTHPIKPEPIENEDQRTEEGGSGSPDTGPNVPIERENTDQEEGRNRDTSREERSHSVPNANVNGNVETDIEIGELFVMNDDLKDEPEDHRSDNSTDENCELSIPTITSVRSLASSFQLPPKPRSTSTIETDPLRTSNSGAQSNSNQTQSSTPAPTFRKPPENQPERRKMVKPVKQTTSNGNTSDPGMTTNRKRSSKKNEETPPKRQKTEPSLPERNNKRVDTNASRFVAFLDVDRRKLRFLKVASSPKKDFPPGSRGHSIGSPSSSPLKPATTTKDVENCISQISSQSTALNVGGLTITPITITRNKADRIRTYPGPRNNSGIPNSEKKLISKGRQDIVVGATTTTTTTSEQQQQQQLTNGNGTTSSVSPPPVVNNDNQGDNQSIEVENVLTEANSPVPSSPTLTPTPTPLGEQTIVVQKDLPPESISASVADEVGETSVVTDTSSCPNPSLSEVEPHSNSSTGSQEERHREIPKETASTAMNNPDTNVSFADDDTMGGELDCNSNDRSISPSTNLMERVEDEESSSNQQSDAQLNSQSQSGLSLSDSTPISVPSPPSAAGDGPPIASTSAATNSESDSQSHSQHQSASLLTYYSNPTNFSASQPVTATARVDSARKRNYSTPHEPPIASTSTARNSPPPRTPKRGRKAASLYSQDGAQNRKSPNKQASATAKQKRFHTLDEVTYISANTPNTVGGAMTKNLYNCTKLIKKTMAEGERSITVIDSLYEKEVPAIVVVTNPPPNTIPIELPALKKFRVKYLKSVTSSDALETYLSELDIKRSLLFFEKEFFAELSYLWIAVVNIDIEVNGVVVLKIDHDSRSLIISRIANAAFQIIEGLNMDDGVSELHLEKVGLGPVLDLDGIPHRRLEKVTLRNVMGVNYQAVKKLNTFIESCELLQVFYCDNLELEVVDYRMLLRRPNLTRLALSNATIAVNQNSKGNPNCTSVSLNVVFFDDCKTLLKLDDEEIEESDKDKFTTIVDVPLLIPTNSTIRVVALRKMNLDIDFAKITTEMPSVEELYLDECRFTEKFIKNFSAFSSLKILKILQGLYSCCTLILKALQISSLAELTVHKLTWKNRRKDRQFVPADDNDQAQLAIIMVAAGLVDTERNEENASFILRRELQSEERTWVGEELTDESSEELSKDYFRKWYRVFYRDYESYKRLNN